jgi:hypothetical protein
MNYYQSQQPTGFHQPRTISANSFPPIGQFTMESALSSPQQQQPAPQGQQMFNNDGSAASIGIFGQNNMMARNGTSNNMFQGNGTAGPADQNQGTRETGIIEKLLVRQKFRSFSFTSTITSQIFSILTASSNAVNARRVCFSTFPNSPATLST